MKILRKIRDGERHDPRVRETALAAAPMSHGRRAARADAFGEVHQIREGLPVGRFFELQELLGVGTAELCEVIGIPLRTLQRRKEEKRLTKDESDRVSRLRSLFDHSASVFESREVARTWFTAPQMALGGMTPLELADTGAGIREIERLLGRIDYGVYA